MNSWVWSQNISKLDPDETNIYKVLHTMTQECNISLPSKYQFNIIMLFLCTNDCSTPAGCPLVNSNANCAELAHAPLVEGSVPRDSPRFRLHPHIATVPQGSHTSYHTFGGSHNPSLRFDNSLEHLSGSEKGKGSFIGKDMTQKQQERVSRARRGGGHGAYMPSLGATASRRLRVSASGEAPSTPLERLYQDFVT